MSRPASYREIEKCCATCAHYSWRRNVESGVCLRGLGLMNRAEADNELRIVSDHGVCDEHRAREEKANG